MKYFFLVLIILSLNSCYSLKNVSIPPELQTYYINKFDNKTFNSPPVITQLFEEKLLNKIRNESRLRYQEIDPNIEFSGAIVGYNVLSVAPEPNETTAFNRLQITVQVSYENGLDEKDKWQQNFSFFENYSSDVNLLDVQDNLISLIYDQIVEDIFNKAFTNW